MVRPSALTSRAAPFAALGLILPLLAIIAPNGTVPALFVAILWAAGLHWRRGDGWPRLPLATLVPLGLLLVWAAVASLWSYDPGRAIVLSLRLAAMFGAGLYLWAVSQSLEPDEREGIAAALAVGLGMALILLLEERLFDTPLMTLLAGPPDDLYAQLSRFNRGATGLALLVWPVTAWLWRRHLGPWALAAPALLLAFLLAFESTAALFGLAGALVLVAIGLIDRRLSRLLTIVALGAVLFVSPLVATLLFEAGWHEADWLARTAAQRVQIWGFTAERILERPLFGWGFDAARNMPNFGFEPLTGHAAAIPLHPHNGALQILLELGYLGAAIAALFLGRLVLALSRAPRITELCGLGMFMAGLGVALTAYGLWQSKWQALLVLSIVLFAAINPIRGADRDRGPL